MASPGCVIVDFGNVIAFFDHGKAARQLAALGRRPLDAQQVYNAVFQTGLEADYDSGRVTTAAFIERLRADLDLQASDAEIARAWNDMYTPNTAMIDAIDRIDRRGVRLVLGSNTNELHYQWLRRGSHRRSIASMTKCCRTASDAVSRTRTSSMRACAPARQDRSPTASTSTTAQTSSRLLQDSDFAGSFIDQASKT